MKDLTKTCRLCNKVLPLEDFRTQVDKRDGKTYRHTECRECGRGTSREYHKKNPEWLKNWARNNPEKIKATKRRNRQKHRTEINAYKRKYSKASYHANPSAKILILLRGRLWEVLNRNNGKRVESTMELLGCPIEAFRKHIESLFEPGMTWANHSKKGWHLDHIIPCVAFDMENPAHQKQCFHYTNFQPLWWDENCSKGGKTTEEQRKLLIMNAI